MIIFFALSMDLIYKNYMGRLYFHMEVVLINAHFLLNASEADIILFMKRNWKDILKLLLAMLYWDKERL